MQKKNIASIVLAALAFFAASAASGASSVMATEQFVRNAVKAESNRTDVAIGNLSTNLEAAIASQYDANATYVTGAICWHDGKLYRCTSYKTPGSWNPFYWKETSIDEMKVSAIEKTTISGLQMYDNPSLFGYVRWVYDKSVSGGSLTVTNGLRGLSATVTNGGMTTVLNDDWAMDVFPNPDKWHYGVRMTERHGDERESLLTIYINSSQVEFETLQESISRATASLVGDVAALAALTNGLISATNYLTQTKVDALKKPILSGEIWIVPEQVFGRVQWAYDTRVPGGSLTVKNLRYEDLVVTVTNGESGVVSNTTDSMAMKVYPRIAPRHYYVEMVDTKWQLSARIQIDIEDEYETLDESIARGIEGKGYLTTNDVDKTLSQTGKAADAKATGDALAGKLNTSGGTVTGDVTFNFSPTSGIGIYDSAGGPVIDLWDEVYGYWGFFPGTYFDIENDERFDFRASATEDKVMRRKDIAAMGFASASDLPYSLVSPAPSGASLPAGVTVWYGVLRPIGSETYIYRSGDKWILYDNGDGEYCEWHLDGSFSRLLSQSVDFRNGDQSTSPVIDPPPNLVLTYPLADRAVNLITDPNGASVALRFPEVAPDYSRDFYVGIVSSDAAPTLTLPTDITLVTTIPGLSPNATNIIRFTEVNTNAFVAVNISQSGSPSPTDASLLAKVSYAELVVAASGGQLTPGKQYQITNYVATTQDSNSQSANHPFDLIVTADTSNTLNEVAKAVRHDGDTYFPRTTKFEGWQVWYCLDNDTARFAWATSGGKGVIYRLVDEFGNDCPYDFKGIKFLAYGDTDSVYRYTFDDGAANSNSDISRQGNLLLVYNNKIAPSFVEVGASSARILNGIVFKGERCYNNTFGDNCNSHTFGNSCFENTFGSGCNGNIFGAECSGNSFGSCCRGNSLGDGSASNTFGTYSGNNVLGASCNYNTFGIACVEIVFGENSETPLDYYQYITVESGNQGIVLFSTGVRNVAQPYQNVTLKAGLHEASPSLTIVDPTDGGQTFHTTFQPKNSKVIEVEK